MKKKQLIKRVKRLTKEVKYLKSKKPTIKSIGFDYLYNHHDENDYED